MSLAHESEEEARILAAARALGRGGASFTMHELARASGMSRATLYRRVQGRERLAERLQARGIEQPPSTRERALAAGRALIVEQGVDGLTIEAIAGRAGLAPTTLYREFGDRQALLRAVLHSIVPLDRLRPLLADHDAPPAGVLARFAAAMLAHLRRQPTMLRLMALRGVAEVAQIRRLRRAEDSTSAALIAYLAAQVERGRLRPLAPARLASSLIGLVIGAHVLHALHEPDLGEPEAVAAELVDLFLRGAAAPTRRRRTR